MTCECEECPSCKWNVPGNDGPCRVLDEFDDGFQWAFSCPVYVEVPA